MVFAPELGCGSEGYERKARQTQKTEVTGPGCGLLQRVEPKVAPLKRIVTGRRCRHTVGSKLSKDQINVQNQVPWAGCYVVKN